MADTIFSKIIKKQIPAKIAFEDETYLAFHDVNPQAPVHVLVIPKKEIPTLNDLTEADAELVGGLFLVARQVMNDLGYRDYRTVFNCGPGAQQTVFHLHLHVLAGRSFSWPPG
jgi:histidine triad (HIT) family protein